MVILATDGVGEAFAVGRTVSFARSSEVLRSKDLLTVDEMGTFMTSGSEVYHREGITRIGNDPGSVRVGENVQRLDGGHDVVVHGIPYDETGSIFLVDGAPTRPYQIADAILANPSYKGEPIRLLTCYGGYGSYSAAQELSDILRVSVQEATGPVGVRRVSSSVPVPVLRQGGWINFYPRDYNESDWVISRVGCATFSKFKFYT